MLKTPMATSVNLMTVPPHLGSFWTVDLSLIAQPERFIAKAMPTSEAKWTSLPFTL